MTVIASWNVNSINARLPNVLEWLEQNKPDVLLMQELKMTEDKFPAEDFEKLGYHCAVNGQKSWNGVAIASRTEPEDVLKGLPGDDGDEQARYIEATVDGLRVASIYLPNGNPVNDPAKYDYKLKWMDRLRAHVAELLDGGQPLVLGGDYNIIPANEDCRNPAAWENDALFKPESRAKFRAILNLGLTDAFRALHDEAHQFTFWDYQNRAWQQDDGIRIDHFLLSPQAADRLEDCRIDKEPRGRTKASDHTPILVEIAA